MTEGRERFSMRTVGFLPPVRDVTRDGDRLLCLGARGDLALRGLDGELHWQRPDPGAGRSRPAK